MAINKIEIKDFFDRVLDIFHLETNDFIIKLNGVFFDFNFKYGDILIHIYTNIDNMHEPYQEVEIKKECSVFDYSWTSFGMLLAYNEETAFNMNINYDYLVECIIKLKSFIDEDKIFFEYYSKDYSKRYFVLENNVRELPIEINLEEETKLRFGYYADRIENNKAFYK